MSKDTPNVFDLLLRCPLLEINLAKGELYDLRILLTALEFEFSKLDALSFVEEESQEEI